MPKYSGFDPIESHSVLTSSTTTGSSNHANTVFTTLYLPFNDDVNDDSPFNQTINNRGSMTIDSTYTKFGSNALKSQTSGSLKIDNPAYSSGSSTDLTGSFTVEFFFYITTAQVNKTLYVHSELSSSYSGLLFWITGSGAFKGYASSNGSGWNIFSAKEFASSITENTWHHVAITWDGSKYRGYYDGDEKWEQSGTTAIGTGGAHYVFSRNNAGQYQPTTGQVYMDDLRVTKGKALYTDDTYTVPTSALGIEQDHPVSLYLPFDSDVNDDSSHSHPVTAYGSATISSTQAKFGGNSLSLNGTNQYLRITDDLLPFQFGSDDFTIEMWIYMTSNAGSDAGDRHALVARRNDSSSRSFHVGIQLDSGQQKLQFSHSTSGSGGSQTNYDTDIQLNTWTHIAIVRSGSSVFAFVDGVKNGTSHSIGTNTIYAGNSGLTIGHRIESSQYFPGYIDDLRITKGIARYTKNFIPPSQAVGATLTGENETNTTTDFTALYLPFTADINDDSSHGHTMTAYGNATISSTQSKFGSNAAYFDGSGDYIAITSDESELSIGTDDFTFEAWVWFQDLSGTQTIFMTKDGTQVVGHYYLRTNGSKLQLQLGSISNSTLLQLESTTDLTAQTWTHVAATRIGSSLKLYIDGTEAGSGTDQQGTRSLVSGDFRVGIGRHGSPFQGYINDLRILRGYAKYRADFVPHTSPIGTSVSETVNDLTTMYLPFDADVSTSSSTTSSSDTKIRLNFEQNPITDQGPGSVSLGNSTSALNTTYKKFGSSSFDGNNNYISFNRSIFDVNADNWTVEAWTYQSSAVGGSENPDFVWQSWGSGNTRDFYAAIGAGNKIMFGYYNNDTSSFTYIVGTSALPTGQFNHLAWVKHNGDLKLYANGVQEGATTALGTVRSNATSLIISHTGTFTFNGYIDDFRMIQDNSLYTGTTYTEPTSTLTNTADIITTTISGGFEDQARNHTITKNGDATINASVKKFGTSSAYFDGTGDYLSSSIDAIGTNDFTIEAWVYPTVVNTYQTLFDNRVDNSTNGGMTFQITNAAKVQVYAKTSLGTTNFTTTATLSANQWYHLALVRKSTGNDQTEIFIDGTSAGTTTIAGDLSLTSFNIGKTFDNYYFNGYIDDYRIIKGHAKYTADFTAPTSALGSELSETSSSIITDTKALSSTWTMTNDGSSPRSFIDMRSDNTWANNEHLQSQPGHRWYGTGDGGGSPSPSTTPVTMKVWGAGGGGAYWNGGSSGSGGAGGFSAGTMNITPGTTLNVVVGTKGLTAGPGRSTPTYPTYPTGPARPLSEGGGGTEVNGTVNHLGASGGGFSAVFDGPVSKPNAIIVAGGGGGGTAYDRSGDDESGGGGSGTPYGNPSVNPPAAAGGGYSGSPTDMQGGVGTQAIAPRAAGGGGGGYRGGQGGFMTGTDGNEHGTGGGGGSGYVAPTMTSTTRVTGSDGTASSDSGSLATNIHPTASSDPDYTGTYGKGGGLNSDGAGGYVVITSPSGTTTFTAPGTYTVP